MCRFASYFGDEKILLDELLLKPKNSLVKQSYKAIEGVHSINADGFGLAWYNFNASSYPGAFKTTQPAWNDNNLMHIAQKINSSCFLAHSRASTVGDVTQNNCHPFLFEEYAMVHNGTIRNFEKYKKSLVDAIDLDLFLQIKGNTDSEHFFFLIMHFIRHGDTLISSVKKAIQWIIDIQECCEGFSRINIAITNGKEFMATRFVSKGEPSISLNYCANLSDKNSSLILSSEPLNDEYSWQELPENHYIYLSKDNMKHEIKSLLS